MCCRYCFGGGAVIEFARLWPDTPGLQGKPACLTSLCRMPSGFKSVFNFACPAHLRWPEHTSGGEFRSEA